jgi:hypothetical protein
LVQPPGIAAASAAAVSAPSTEPTIISKNAGLASGNSGVVLYGGQPTAITPAAAPASPAGSPSLATASTHPGLLNTFRPLRTDVVVPQPGGATAPPANVRPISREESMLQMEVLRTAHANNPNFPPLPPTELTDMVNAEQQQLQQQRLQQQQQNRGLPPSPFGAAGPPPMPGR